MQNIRRFLRGNIYNKIKTLATIPENTITQRDLIGMKNIPYKNRILTATQFLHNEMPIRFARRIVDLEDLPFNIYQNNPITNISECYSESLEDILNLPFPTDYSQCSQFFDVIQKIVDRHSHTLDSMSKGINEYKQHEYKQNAIIDDEIFNLNIFLAKFNRNRTKTRLLLHNYLEYYREDVDTNRIGILNLKCNLQTVLNNVVNDLENITMTNHMEFPSIEFDINPLDFIYVDSYLHYTFLEILKNSVKAIHDSYKYNNEINNGTIKITTSHKDENMYILKISDNGIGIKPENLNKIWNFSYTTSFTNLNDCTSDSINSPISGFGYGLSISKIILKTFADHIKVYSEYKKGTDVYIFFDLKSNWII